MSSNRADQAGPKAPAPTTSIMIMGKRAALNVKLDGLMAPMVRTSSPPAIPQNDGAHNKGEQLPILRPDASEDAPTSLTASDRRARPGRPLRALCKTRV